MARRARRGLVACAFVLGFALLPPVAGADPDVLPIAGGGTSAQNDVLATDALFKSGSPTDVAVLHSGSFFYREYAVADPADCKIRKVSSPSDSTSDIGTISTIVGTGCSTNDPGSADGTQQGRDYTLSYPTGVVARTDNSLLIADHGTGRVHLWTSSNGKIVTVAGPDAFSPPNCTDVPVDNDPAVGATFCSLAGIASNPTDTDKVLIVDSGQRNAQGQVTFPGRVYEIYRDTNLTPELRIRTVAGGCAGGVSNARDVCFTNPVGITFTGNGSEFLVTDAGRKQVFRFDSTDNTIADVVAGSGQATSSDGSNSGDGGPATAATFASDGPGDVEMTADGGYFLADTYNCKVRKVTDLTPQAKIYSIAGTCGDSGTPDTTPKSASQANLYPLGLALAPGGLYVANQVTRQVQLLDRTTITNKPPLFTNSTAATFSFESLEFGGTFTCLWDGSAQPCASPPSSFQEGTHRFSVRTSSGQEDPTPALWQWTVDTTAPTGLAAVTPEDGAVGLPPSPTFTWHPADGSISGLDHYELLIDGKKDHDVKLADCSADPCTATPGAALPEGRHTWKIKALDLAGNVAETSERTLASGSPPNADFAIAPNPALAGRSVTFDASASNDASGPIARYEWDLDGDGTFETDGGTNPTTTKTYTKAGALDVQLRVTDGVGLTAGAKKTLTISEATIPGQLGVTINDRAQYTNKPDVTLTIAAPLSVTRLLVSNDGGFLDAKSFTPAKTIPWKLDSTGPERLPKTVYVRFVSGPITSPNYTDDIILDERPPVVDQASVAAVVPPAASAATTAALKKWRVKVKAHDTNSGVRYVQVTASKKKPGRLIRYKRRLTVKAAQRPKFLRARDRAGNFSRWKKLR